MSISLEYIVIFILFAVIGYLIYESRRAGGSNRRSPEYDHRQHQIDQVSRSMDDLRQGLSDSISERLEQNNDSFIKSLQRQSQHNNAIISDVTKSLTQIEEANKRVLSVSDELKTIQTILTNPKQRGVLGEYYLESVLQNVLPPDKFQMQHKFKDGSIVDAVVYLDKKILPIDSKFSLENYNRLVESKAGRDRDDLVRKFKADLKARIDETAKYIKPDEDTMDFAFMFIPSEAIYYDLLINKVGSSKTHSSDLIEYAFNEKHVVIVSPTSFMAYLQTVMQGLRSLRIEEQAKHIQTQVKLLGKHFSRHNEYIMKMGKTLSTTVNHYNNAHRELVKMDKDVGSITGDGGLRLPADSVERPDSQE